MQYVEMAIEAYRVPSEPAAPAGTISFKVRVLSSPAGELSNADAVLGSFVEQDLRGDVEKIRARELQPGGVDLVAFGRQLAGWLLPASAVRDLYARSLELAGQDGGLRLRLRLSPKLAWIPWEYLYVDPPGGGGQRDGFLALNQRVAIVRHEALPLSLPRVQPPPDATLKVAAAMALAADRDQLDLGGEQKSLEAIFGTKGVDYRFVDGATIQDILDNLQDDAHVFHFSGHGAFQRDAASRSTYVGTGMQEMEDGSLVGADQLSLNVRSPALRLALIGACDSGSRGDIWAENPWGGTATMLAKIGVPAVIGNQFTIRDDCAIAFSKAFYTALFGGLPIEQAVVIGRVAIFNVDKDGRDWGVPVLYMRAPDGQLFNGVADRAAREKARKEAESYIEQRVEVRGDGNTVNAQSYGKMQAQSISIVTNNYAGAKEEPDPTPLPQPIADKYVNREETERELREALLKATPEAPVVVLWGRYGMGKGRLAAFVASQLFDEGRFEGGVLWGDYAGRRTEELLRSYFGQLGARWAQPAEVNAESFWQTLNNRARPTLVVAENLPGLKELRRLIPPASLRGKSRLLVICDFEVDPEAQKIEGIAGACRVGPFSPEQAALLFEKVLGGEIVKKYRDELLEIGKLYSYTPPELYRAARTLAAGKLNPATFLDRLRATTDQNTSLDEAALRQQDLYLQDLSPLQADLFNLTYLLGAGDWSIEMLAAISLTPIKDVRAAIEALTGRALVKQVSPGRYQNDGAMRDVARRRFEARPEYECRAAYHLLARACIGMAQDLKEQLRQQRLRDGDEKFYATFRDRLNPEVPHIRRVLEWAAEPQQSYWEIIRRFSGLPYMGLIKHLVAGCQMIYVDMQMATIDGLVLSMDYTDFDAQALRFVNGAGVLGVVGKDGREGPYIYGDQPARVEPYLQQTTSENQKIEVSFRLRGGRIVEGIIAGADLDYVNWIGVFAHRIVWINADLVGARFVACDMLQSIWAKCEASRAMMTGSDLNGAIFSAQTKLRGADFSGANLTNAIFDDVDLRDANLAGANLAGAIFNKVNLTRAQLNGANLSGSTLNNVDLRDANLSDVSFANAWFGDQVKMLRARVEGVNWAGAQGAPLLDEALLDDFEQGRAARVDLPAPPSRPYGWLPPSRDLTGGEFSAGSIPKADLRATNLANLRFIRAKFVDGDFRAATIESAYLDGVTLSRADLSAASLCWAMLDDVGLERGQLSGANLMGAHVRDGSLRGAKLYASILWYTFAYQTDMRDADLRFALLGQASLIGVNLTGASFGDQDAPEQWETALGSLQRLRGSTLPDGKRYAGQYNLPGDLADAQALGVDTNDPKAMRQFYHDAPLGDYLEMALRHTVETAPPDYQQQCAATADELLRLIEQSTQPGADLEALRVRYDELLSSALSALRPAIKYAAKENAPAIVRGGFAKIREAIKHLAGLNAAQKHAVGASFKTITDELARGDGAKASRLARELRDIGDVAPALLYEICSYLGSVVLGFPAEIRSVAQEAAIFAHIRELIGAQNLEPPIADAAADALRQIEIWRTSDEDLDPLTRRLALLEGSAAGALDALVAAVDQQTEAVVGEIGATIRGIVAETGPLLQSPAPAAPPTNGTEPAPSEPAPAAPA